MTRTERIIHNRAHIAAVRAFLRGSRKMVRQSWRPEMKIRLVRKGSEITWLTRQSPGLGERVTVRGERWTVASVIRTTPGSVSMIARGTG